MNLPDAVKHCLQHYITFSGRASRSEFWYFRLAIGILGLVLRPFDQALFPTYWAMQAHLGPLCSALYVISFLPSVSVAVRRLHDINRSGWWFWIVMLPIIGWIILIIWYCTKGTTGDNRFGPDPLSIS